jgi:hypothetical protein
LRCARRKGRYRHAHAEGDELVIAHIADTEQIKPGLPNFTGDPSKTAQVTILVAGKSHSLAGHWDSPTTLVVSATKGAPVLLQLHDGGRTQSLDLRTGLRGSDAISMYYPVLTTTLNLVPIVYAAGNEANGVVVNPADSITLAPYDGTRWARKGRTVHVPADAGGDDAGQSARGSRRGRPRLRRSGDLPRRHLHLLAAGSLLPERAPDGGQARQAVRARDPHHDTAGLIRPRRVWAGPA